MCILNSLVRFERRDHVPEAQDVTLDKGEPLAVRTPKFSGYKHLKTFDLSK